MSARKSNIELLRIICILMIISFHYVYKGGFQFDGFTINEFFVKIFWMFGELGVNIFVLITGYFLIHGRFRFKKLVLLIFEVLFYHLVTIVLASRVGMYDLPVNWRTFVLEFFPVTRSYYWLITVYILIYILSPYLNMFAKMLSKRDYIKFLTIVLLLWSVIPTVFGLFYNTTESLLYYNRFIWLIIVYFIGAYIRLHSLNLFKNRGRAVVISFLLIVGSILFIEKFEEYFWMIGTYETAYFWTPNSVLMILLSVSMFDFFLHMDIPYNGLINKLASTTLGIYILHDGVFVYYLWHVIFKNAQYQESKFLLLHILFATVIIFVAGACIDLLRQCFIEKNIARLWDLQSFCNLRAGIFKKIESGHDWLEKKL